MFVGMNRQAQGDLGEASARCWYAFAGHDIYLPTGHSPDADFIADSGDHLIRVQVKTCGYIGPRGRWEVSICTRGGNQSWSGVTKHFSAERCDELFVVTMDGRRWRIAAAAVEATAHLNLGGRKYAEYEVDPGPPLGALRAPSSLPSRAPAG